MVSQLARFHPLAFPFRVCSLHIFHTSVFRCLCLLLPLCGVLFFHGLGDRDLWSSHEGRAAQNARSILVDGCWLLPKQVDGKVELQKPPLYYWLVAAASYCQGGTVDGWSVRLPAALSGAGCVVGLFLFGWMCGRPLAGMLAAMALATMLHFTSMARTGRIDMPLALAVGVALGCFYLSYRREKRGWMLPAYVAIAIALLLKGPIGLILTVASATAFLAFEMILTSRSPADKTTSGGDRASSTTRPLAMLASTICWGVLLTLALAAPWYVLVERQTGGRLYQTFLWYHNFARAFGGGELRAHPWWFYGPRLAFDLLPWGLLMPAATWYYIRGGRWKDDAEARFGFLWFAVMALLLSCVRFKRADYLLPAYPGAALLLGCAGERWYLALRSMTGPRRQAAARWLGLGFGAIVCACAAGWCVYVDHILPGDETAREQRTFARAIRRFAPSPELVIFFRVESHALAFHVGRHLNTILEWENIDTWAGRPGTHYIVMPPECAQEWREHVHSGRLEEVLRNVDLSGGRHEQPMVLMRTRPLETK